MPQNNYILPLILGLALLFTRCVEPYDLEKVNLGSPRLVIEGQITNKAGFHYVNLSESSSPTDPEFIPVSYCVVYLMDEFNNVYPYEETWGGKHRIYLDSLQLLPGRSFKLLVHDQLNNVEYESEWDTIPVAAPIPDVYGVRSDEEQASGETLNGVQFYVDFEGGAAYSDYYRYEIQETFEYHARYPIDWVYEGSIQRSAIGDAYKICYRDVELQDIFTLTTAPLQADRYPGFPLHHTLEKSEKLNHRYSVLLTQIAMSEASYRYWKAIEENSQRSGGLFDKQPLSIQGNIYNTTQPQEKVLGNFSVTTVLQKRFFFTPDEFGLEGYDRYPCIPFEDPEISFVPPSSWPLYMVASGGSILRADHVCFDCRLSGGTLVKPDFWQ